MSLRAIFNKVLEPAVIIAVGTSLLLSCNEEYHYTHGSVYGTITDATTGDSIENCNVSVSDASGNIVDRQTTDDKGTYKTKDISEGKYTVSVEREDYYAGASKSIQTTPGETTQCDIQLSRLPAKITADTEEIDFGADESLTTISFKIVNRYLDDLDWVVEYDCEWIASVSPDKDNLAHGKTATIIVKIDREKLSAGDNKTNLVVKSRNGQGGVNIAIKAVGAYRESPSLNVTGVSNIDMTSAVLNGEIVKVGTPAYSRRGFTCSHTSMDDNASELLAEVNSNAAFSYSFSGLEAGKKYYVRAFAFSEYAGKVWSANEASFSTIGSYPQVRTDDVSSLDLTKRTCVLNGYIEQTGNPAYQERGFCVSDSVEPTVENSKYTVAGSGTGQYTFSLQDLSTEKTYRVRAYAIQNGNAFYGSTISFSTVTTPTSVATTGASSVNHNSAVLNGTIMNDGNPKYTERGFCYSTNNKTPSITNSKISVTGTSAKDFSYYLSGLEYNKTFWFRAYAIQNSQPIYGDVASFETTWAETTVFTMDASEIKYYEMTLNGQINAAGTPAYTQKGFCYSILEENPTLNNSTKLVVSGSSEGQFSYHLTGLTGGTAYYYRAFAIQDGTTIYGDVKSSTTYSPPMVVTTDAYARPDAGTFNLSWTIELTGVYGYKGNPECNDFGFVYGPGDNPTADNTYGYTVVQATKIEPFANSQGSFSVTLTSMPGYQKYYYRAYAKTSLGYTYGEVMAVSTQP